MPARNLAPEDAPIAPSQVEWDAMSPAERDRVVASLPYVVENDFMSEGDHHALVVDDTVDALRNHFGGDGPGSRRMYVGRSVMVHYPNERGFAPDIFVVFDVVDKMRESWVVSREGKGFDVAIEVLWKGDARKDYHRNVALYASVGIPEYFVFDMNRMVITGHRLEPSASTYRPILGQGGRFWSEILGLHIAVQGDQFRFFSGVAMLPTNRELQRRLHEGMVAAMERAAAESERANAEAERAEAAMARALAAEQRLQELLGGQKPD